MYLFLYFLKFILSIIFLEDHFGNKCAIVCFNVSILGKYYIYMYYTVYQINSLTHSQCRCVSVRETEKKIRLFTTRMKEVILGRLELAVTESVLASFTHNTHSIHP